MQPIGRQPQRLVQVENGLPRLVDFQEGFASTAKRLGISVVDRQGGGIIVDRGAWIAGLEPQCREIAMRFGQIASQGDGMKRILLGAAHALNLFVEIQGLGIIVHGQFVFAQPLVRDRAEIVSRRVIGIVFDNAGKLFDVSLKRLFGLRRIATARVANEPAFGNTLLIARHAAGQQLSFIQGPIAE